MGRITANNWCGTHAWANAHGTQTPCVVVAKPATANKVIATLS